MCDYYYFVCVYCRSKVEVHGTLFSVVVVVVVVSLGRKSTHLCNGGLVA